MKTGYALFSQIAFFSRKDFIQSFLHPLYSILNLNDDSLYRKLLCDSNNFKLCGRAN